MKKTLLILMLSAVICQNAFADDSVNHSGKASKHSVLASSGSLTTTASVASAVVAVPVIATGSVMVASGNALAESAEDSKRRHREAHTAEPIEITETINTVDPAPNKVKVTTTTR